MRFLLALLLCVTTFAHGKELDAEVFASLPAMESVSLSPDGTKVASLIRRVKDGKQATYVNIYDLATKSNEYPVSVDDSKYQLIGLTWKNERFILIESYYPGKRYGIETGEYQLLKLDLTNNSLKRALPAKFKGMQIQSSIVDMLPQEDNTILVRANGVSKVWLDKRRAIALKTQGNGTGSWMSDAQGNVRIAFSIWQNRIKVWEQLADQYSLRLLWEYEAFSQDEILPLGFAEDPDVLYVRTPYKKTSAVFKVNLTDPELKKELVHYDENRDVSWQFRRSPDSNELIGVGDTYWHKTAKAIHVGAEKALPDYRIKIVNFSRNMEQYLIFASNNTEPGIYLVGDRKKKSLDLLNYKYDAITPDIVAAPRNIEFQSETTQAWITLPPGDKKAVPTIVVPRLVANKYENVNYNFIVQFLANRGYAVVEVRSDYWSGISDAFSAMPLNEATLRSEVGEINQVLARAKSIAAIDTNNMCIFASGYNSIAAYASMFNNKNQYKCLATFGGVTDLELLRENAYFYVGYELMKFMLGDSDELLEEKSPVNQLNKINVPILLLHGENDRRIRNDQSQEMYEKLKDAGKSVNYIELESGGHYFQFYENKLKILKELDRFFSRHLK